MTTFFLQKVIPSILFVFLVQTGRQLLDILTDDGMIEEMNNNNMHASGSVSAFLTMDVSRNISVCTQL